MRMSRADDPSKKKKQVVMLLAKPYVIDSRVMNEASSLLEHGYDVQVISWDRDGHQPSRFEYKGAKVRSLRLIGGKSFSQISFLLSALLLQAYTVYWCLRNSRVSFVLHANDVNTLLGGVIVKLIKGSTVRLVYDCHELTPGIYAAWSNRLWLGVLVGVMEKRLMMYADRVITVSPGYRAYILRETKRDPILVYNVPRVSLVPPDDKETWKKKLGLSGFVVSFVGYIRNTAALEGMIEVAKMFRERNIDGISFVVVGSGPDYERLSSLSKGVDNFRILPDVPYPIALGYVRASDVVFAVYRDWIDDSAKTTERNWLFGGSDLLTMHWKVSEAMACDACPIMRSDTVEWKFVNRIGFGLSAGSGTVPEIFQALNWALSNPDKTRALAEIGHRKFLSDFNWENMADRLIMAYEG
jgi:glycosyltransferase involved in cell wall biosynthesis